MSPACRLYLITPPVIEDLAAFTGLLTEAMDAGDVAALQIRLKGAGDAAIAAVVQAIAPSTRARDVALLLNDNPDLAVQLACDGVHIGQQDGSPEEARRVMGDGRIVGVTCHDSRHLAIKAAEGGADYVAFGAFFPTATKNVPDKADPEILRIWQETMLSPCVAIGGITTENCRPLVAAGADFLAVSAGVWRNAAGPAAAVRAFSREIAEGLAMRR